ncbi:MAG TPA: hypothetical protein VGE77_13700 [Nocardioides sp.]
MHGVYVAAQVRDSTALRIASLRLVVPDDAVVCDRHAGWIHGADMILAPGEHLHARPIRIFRPAGTARLRRAGIDGGQRALLARDVEDVEGLLVTTRLRTALDLGRQGSRAAAISGIDAMLRLGVDVVEVVAEVDRFVGDRWVRTLREVAPLGSSLSASAGESATKLAWYDVTGTMPDLQIRVTGPGGGWADLDLGSSALRFAVEYDGEEWHDEPDQVERDRVRRQHIERAHDFDIEVVRKANVYGPERDIEDVIRRGLLRNRLRFVA